jgi:hypothetical protein
VAAFPATAGSLCASSSGRCLPRHLGFRREGSAEGSHHLQGRGRRRSRGWRRLPASMEEEAAGEDGGGWRAWRRRRPASMEEDAAGGPCLDSVAVARIRCRDRRRRRAGKARGGCAPPSSPSPSAPPQLLHRRPHHQLRRRPHPESQRRRARSCSSSSACSGSRKLCREAAWIYELAG